MLAITIIFGVTSQNQLNTIMPKFEVKGITSIESIVTLGLGRSRLISTNAD